MVWATTAWEPVPVVEMVPELVKLISPELEVSFVLFKLTTPDDEPPTPPPPPMVCKSTPKLLSPVVVITPVFVALISPELVVDPA